MGAAGAASDPTYVDDVFSTALYTGNASSNTVPSGLDFTEGSWLSWIKLRDGSDSHFLSDSTQKTGVCFDSLASDRTYGKQTGETTGINAVGTSSYSIQGSNAQVNGNTKKYASWNFKAAPGFLDIVTWTGNSTAGRQIPHALGSVPGMIMIKRTSSAEDWIVGHRSIGLGTGRLVLNDNTGNSNGSATTYWNNTAATSSQFTVGSHVAVNGNGDTYVAYIFAHDDARFGTDEDESIIKCGTWTASGGAGSINLGFEPQLVLTKNASGAGAWFIFDNMRGMAVGGNDAYLRPDTSDDENSGSNFIELTSTGFDVNLGSSQDFIYMAIRRPNKPPEISTDVFAIDTGNSSSTIPAFDSGFPVDFALLKEYNTGSNDNFTFNRLTGSRVMRTNTSAAEVNGGGLWIGDSNVGWSKQYNNTNISYMFKRAPGFMDVVAYTGTGSATTINHNLGVAPSVVLIKGRNTTYSWYWQHYALGANTWMQLNNQEAGAGNGNIFNNTLPTSSVFSVGSLAGTNGSGNTYIAYLFGDLPGVSKAGTYTGTGSNINVNCGFTNGARFVLIKRTDGPGGTNVGDWYVWDTSRGIASGYDPYLLLNTDAAQVTNTDYIDPNIYGFTVTSSAPAALNTSGGTYLFLAIA